MLADVLETLRLTNVVYGRFDLGAPWGLQFPRMELAHFYVVARGGGILAAEGAEHTFTLSAGDVAVIPLGAAHSLRDATGSSAVTLATAQCTRHGAGGEVIRLGGAGARTSIIGGAFEFSAGRRTCLLENLPPVIHLPSNDPRAMPWLGAIVQLIVAESAAPKVGGAVMLSRLADMLLIQALRVQTSSQSCQEHGLRGLNDPHVGQALKLMHGQLNQPWTVESLAEAVGQSRSGFAAKFHELVGEPPLQYLARWRMTKAAQQLRETDATLAEVAGKAGYLSEASFNKAFKRWEGTAPGAYRRRHRQDGRRVPDASPAA